MIAKSLNYLILMGVCTVFLTNGVIASSDASDNMNTLSINLKARAVVLGPVVKLGDIGNILIPDQGKRTQISSVIVGHAPPPGESAEISLNYVKRCLKLHGFENYLPVIHGPRTIRIITAHVEIDKAFLRQEFALNSEQEEGLSKCSL